MKSENLKYLKVRKVKNPNRNHYDDAGIDIFVPEDLTYDQMQEKFETTGCHIGLSFAEDNKTITEFRLEPGESVLIPSGLKFNVPKGYAVIAFNKSGIAAKRSLDIGSSVVDESYTGEVHIYLHNVSNKRQTIKAGEKIVQFLVIPINYCELEESNSVEELYFGKENSGRGEGGFGSTGV